MPSSNTHNTEWQAPHHMTSIPTTSSKLPLMRLKNRLVIRKLIWIFCNWPTQHHLWNWGIISANTINLIRIAPTAHICMHLGRMFSLVTNLTNAVIVIQCLQVSCLILFGCNAKALFYNNLIDNNWDQSTNLSQLAHLHLPQISADISADKISPKALVPAKTGNKPIPKHTLVKICQQAYFFTILKTPTPHWTWLRRIQNPSLQN